MSLGLGREKNEQRQARSRNLAAGVTKQGSLRKSALFQAPAFPHYFVTHLFMQHDGS